jgi:hypothetical protein
MLECIEESFDVHLEDGLQYITVFLPKIGTNNLPVIDSLSDEYKAINDE